MKRGTFKSRGKPLKRSGRIKPKRMTKAQRDWSRTVLERDKTCTWPLGCKRPATDPHHVATRARRPDLKLDPANGRGLCREHHNWVGENPLQATEMGLLSDESYELAMKRQNHVHSEGQTA